MSAPPSPLRSLRALPEPPGRPVLGHMTQWTFRPVPLLEAGARAGDVFRLRLWRPVVVGYRPDWNRAVLKDLDAFRSRGSLSGLTPYLAGGVVHTDVPDHTVRRRALNPHFHSRALDTLADRLRQDAAAAAPDGPFEALAYSGTLIRRMLNVALFAGALPDPLLARFLAPLDRPHPAPLLPRPRLFGTLDAAIDRLLVEPPPGSLAAALAGTGPIADVTEELRVALAAGYDTTAHTLAWALWHLAGQPRWRHLDTLPMVLDEVQRLYPAGWLGSRITSRDTAAAGVELPAGTMVLYSPYLTHRDPRLWPDPTAFRPERFHDHRPAWGFIPFSAGPRTCLGAHLARLMLRCALEPFCDRGRLAVLDGDPGVAAGITLRPAGPLRLRRARPLR
jgi:cytochrome P450